MLFGSRLKSEMDLFNLFLLPKWFLWGLYNNTSVSFYDMLNRII